MRLSIIIPCYNESKTIAEVIKRVKNSPVEDKEIIVVDDCSNDGTAEILKNYDNSYKPDIPVKIFYHENNQGKGAAIKTGISFATGDAVVIQDADFEYNPDEYPNLMQPIIEGKADVVYGSRFSSGYAHRVLYFWHRLGNGFLTLLSNIFTNNCRKAPCFSNGYIRRLMFTKATLLYQPKCWRLQKQSFCACRSVRQ